MRVFPADRDGWNRLLVFPFKAYLPLGFIGLLFWNAATSGHQVRGGLAEATGRVLIGYTICTVAFLALAVIRFARGRRELVAESLLLAGITFFVGTMIMCWSLA
jgi:hypothetical protein